MDIEDSSINSVAAWVEQNGFRRVAIQFPDELLIKAPYVVMQLQKALLGRKIFVVGDSASGSSSVDDVGAEHYGADCIVHVGPSDQQHASSLPVFFILGKSALMDTGASVMASALHDHVGKMDITISTLIICEVAFQHAMDKFVSAFQTMLCAPDCIFIAEPQQAVSVGNRSSLLWRDWRFGVLPLAAWWASLGIVTLAATATPQPLLVCGREVRQVSGRPHPNRLPERCVIVYVGNSNSALERRLLLRHGQAHPIWRLDPIDNCAMLLSSDPLLMQRYRYVELVKSAAVVGLLVCTSGALYGKAIADRLELLLRSAGRRVYRFVVGVITPEKLGNFQEIECFVSLASPENFPFSMIREHPVPIASPYEVEVALGVREWTGDYITDLEELFNNPPLGELSDMDTLSVQTLGAQARIRHFSMAGRGSEDAQGPTIVSNPASKPPAQITPGLHGVAASYEPLCQN